MQTLQEALPYKHWITAVGLDSSEVGNPPIKFQQVFAKALAEGWLTVAHAGEEGGAGYIWDALKHLKISRVDHGNHAIEDEALMQYLLAHHIPLTMCPLSNYKLKVQPDLSHHPLKKMLDRGLLVTVNSDDPAYFGGYINENYLAIQKALNLSQAEIYKLAENSFIASFLNEKEKTARLKLLSHYSQFLLPRQNEQ